MDLQEWLDNKPELPENWDGAMQREFGMSLREIIAVLIALAVEIEEGGDTCVADIIPKFLIGDKVSFISRSSIGGETIESSKRGTILGVIWNALESAWEYSIYWTGVHHPEGGFAEIERAEIIPESRLMAAP